MEAIRGGGEVHALSEPLLSDAKASHKESKGVNVNILPSYSAPCVPGIDGRSHPTQLATSAQCSPPRRLVAELQIETLSTPCVRFFFYSWYVVLLLAFLLQSFPSLQWEMRNICGATGESLFHLHTWTSPCVQRDEYLPSDVNSSAHVSDSEPYVVTREVFHGSAARNAFDRKERGAFGNSTWSRHRLQNLRWVGDKHGDFLDVKLNRFVRIVLSMASPRDKLPAGVLEKRYLLMVAVEGWPLPPSDDGSNSSLETVSDMHISAPLPKKIHNFSTLCLRTDPRCSSVVLPEDVVVATNGSQIVLTIYGVDEELGNVSASSSVGLAFQRSSYTISTIALRYIFLLFSTLHFIRFMYRKRYSKTLYEQYWVMVLHFSLLLYLDPFFVAGVFKFRGVAVFQFFEFRIPNYFAALLSSFVFALITASINWTECKRESDSMFSVKQRVLKEDASRHRDSGTSPVFESTASVDYQPVTAPPSPLLLQHQYKQQRWREHDEEEEKVNEQGSQWMEDFSGTTPSAASDVVRHVGVVHHSGMPLWATLTVIGFFLAVLFLDITRWYVENWTWSEDGTCMNLSCVYIYYTFYSLLMLLIFASCGLLVRLHRNLGKRPYLETRPHQLACRVFIFVFFTALMYFVGQVILITFVYPMIIGIVAYHPFSELSSIMVSTFFVNHITFVYTTTLASRRVPIRPDNPHWRRTVWSSEWYRWLNLHGGILYIFFNERQERYFNWLQNNKVCASKRKKPKPSRNTGITATGDNKVRGFHGGNANDTTTNIEVMQCDPDSDENESSDLTDFFGNSEEELSSSALSSTEYFNDDNNVEGAPQEYNPPSPKAGVNCDILKYVEEGERRLIDRSIAIIDRLESALVDPLQSLLLRGRGRMPFFNLETAIDCLNLSWEAYVTTEDRLGSVMSACATETTSASFGLERLQHVLRLCTFCCCRKNGGDDNVDDTDARGDDSACGENRDTDVIGVTVPVGASLHPSSSFLPSPLSDVGGEEDKKKNREEVEEGDNQRLGMLQPHPVLRMSTEQYGYTHIAVYEGCDVQVVISVMNTTLPCHLHKFPRIVIAFRGTTNMSNAWQDLRFRQRRWREVNKRREWGIAPRPKVHSGFLNIWISLKASVLPTLRAYLTAHPEVVYRVFCTGHSLGGALATLCAYSVRELLRLMKYPLTDVTVYTFGQPPLGNRAFQSAYNKAVPRTFRVVNESDAVALINMYGYHVGIEVDIDRHGNYICKPTYMERLFRPTQGKGFALKNHILISYVQSLNAVAERNAGGACKVRSLVPYVQGFSSPLVAELQSS